MFSIRAIRFVLLLFVIARIFFFFYEAYKWVADGFPLFWIFAFEITTVMLWVLALVMLASGMTNGYYLAGFLGLISIPEFLIGVTDYPLGIEVFIVVWLLKAMEKFSSAKEKEQ